MHGGGDTITQIISDYSTSNLYTRSGDPSDVGGTGGWTAWKKVAYINDLAGYLPMTGGTLSGALYVRGLMSALNEYENIVNGYTWRFGDGTGTGVYGQFGFYRADVGTIVTFNNDELKHKTCVKAGDKASMWTDSEGGNISLIGNNGTKWSIDALDGVLRFILNESSVPINFYSDGGIATHKGTVLTTGNFSLSGTTLTITT